VTPIIEEKTTMKKLGKQRKETRRIPQQISSEETIQTTHLMTTTREVKST
jgi:hypothetical protein